MLSQFYRTLTSSMHTKWSAIQPALMQSEKGQGLPEYGLILALIAVALIASLTDLKDGIAGVFSALVAAFG
jgi:Flp pilus assembly pilin Flp